MEHKNKAKAKQAEQSLEGIMLKGKICFNKFLKVLARPLL
jgi:hypothetical protein